MMVFYLMRAKLIWHFQANIEQDLRKKSSKPMWNIALIDFLAKHSDVQMVLCE